MRLGGRKEDKIIWHDSSAGWSSASCRLPIHDHFLPTTPFFITPQISFVLPYFLQGALKDFDEGDFEGNY